MTDSGPRKTPTFSPFSPLCDNHRCAKTTGSNASDDIIIAAAIYNYAPSVLAAMRHCRSEYIDQAHERTVLSALTLLLKYREVRPFFQSVGVAELFCLAMTRNALSECCAAHIDPTTTPFAPQAQKDTHGTAMESQPAVNALLASGKLAMASGDRTAAHDQLHEATKVSPSLHKTWIHADIRQIAVEPTLCARIL